MTDKKIIRIRFASKEYKHEYRDLKVSSNIHKQLLTLKINGNFKSIDALIENLIKIRNNYIRFKKR